MALDIQIGIQNNKTTMVLVDNTGDYDAVSNTGGWGTPNPTRATVSSAAVVVTPPGGTALASISLGSFLTSTSELSSDITSELDSLDTSLEDGIWKYTFTFGGSSIPDPVVYALRDNIAKAKLVELALLDLDKVPFAKLKEIYDKMLYAFEAEEYVLAEELMADLNALLEDCVTTDFRSGC
jgi:hypothetical protein